MLPLQRNLTYAFIMNKETEQDILNYIFTYCTAYWTKEEGLAYTHYVAVLKCDPSKEKNQLRKKFFDKMYTTDPKALELLKDGFQTFKDNLTKRIWKAHGHHLALNRCPKCNGIARTPQAKQCRYCGHNWH